MIGNTNALRTDSPHRLEKEKENSTNLVPRLFPGNEVELNNIKKMGEIQPSELQKNLNNL